MPLDKRCWRCDSYGRGPTIGLKPGDYKCFSGHKEYCGWTSCLSDEEDRLYGKGWQADEPKLDSAGHDLYGTREVK